MSKSHEIGNVRGELGTKMEKLVPSSSWKQGNTLNLTINKKPVVTINPNPTSGQPGNAKLTFNGKAPNYEELKQSANKNYSKRHEKLDKVPLKKELNTRNKSDQLYVLSKFEEARRVPGDESGHLSRKQVKEGNKKAIRQKRPKAMIEQYTGPPAKRQKAHQQIMKSGSSIGSTSSSGHGKTKVTAGSKTKAKAAQSASSRGKKATSGVTKPKGTGKSRVSRPKALSGGTKTKGTKKANSSGKKASGGVTKPKGPGKSHVSRKKASSGGTKPKGTRKARVGRKKATSGHAKPKGKGKARGKKR